MLKDCFLGNFFVREQGNNVRSNLSVLYVLQGRWLYILIYPSLYISCTMLWSGGRVEYRTSDLVFRYIQEQVTNIKLEFVTTIWSFLLGNLDSESVRNLSACNRKLRDFSKFPKFISDAVALVLFLSVEDLVLVDSVLNKYGVNGKLRSLIWLGGSPVYTRKVKRGIFLSIYYVKYRGTCFIPSQYVMSRAWYPCMLCHMRDIPVRYVTCVISLYFMSRAWYPCMLCHVRDTVKYATAFEPCNWLVLRDIKYVQMSRKTNNNTGIHLCFQWIIIFKS